MFTDMSRFCHRVNIERTWEDPEKTIFCVAMELSNVPYNDLEEILDVYAKGVGMANLWRLLTLSMLFFSGCFSFGFDLFVCWCER